jgi:hypothetical protein
VKLFHNSSFHALCSVLFCPGVEIGRQATLRWWCPKGRAGSNPVLGTTKSLEDVDFQDFSLLMCVGFAHFLSLFATFFDTKKTHFMTRRFSGCRILSTKECKLHEKQVFFQKIFT